MNSQQFQIIVTGERKSGRSSIISRYINQQFTDQQEFIDEQYKHKKQINNVNYNLLIWDSRVKDIQWQIVQESTLIIYVTDSKTPLKIKEFQNMVDKVKDLQQQFTCQIALFLNKIDLMQSSSYLSEYFQFCQKHDILYFGGSAKENINVSEVFELALRQINELQVKQSDIMNEKLIQSIKIDNYTYKQEAEISCHKQTKKQLQNIENKVIEFKQIENKINRSNLDFKRSLSQNKIISIRDYECQSTDDKQNDKDLYEIPNNQHKNFNLQEVKVINNFVSNQQNIISTVNNQIANKITQVQLDFNKLDQKINNLKFNKQQDQQIIEKQLQLFENVNKLFNNEQCQQLILEQKQCYNDQVAVKLIDCLNNNIENMLNEKIINTTTQQNKTKNLQNFNISNQSTQANKQNYSKVYCIKQDQEQDCIEQLNQQLNKIQIAFLTDYDFKQKLLQYYSINKIYILISEYDLKFIKTQYNNLQNNIDFKLVKVFVIINEKSYQQVKLERSKQVLKYKMQYLECREFREFFLESVDY